MAAITMKMGSRMAALAVVAEMNADSTTLITMKLMKMEPAFLPKRRMNQSAKRLATPVATSMLARMKDMILSHITRCPNWA